MQYIDLSEIVQFMKAVSIMTSVQLKKSTLIVVSHVLSTKVVPEWRSNTGFGTQNKCPYPVNRGVPSIEITGTKIMWAFFRDQILCPVNGEVP